MSATGAPDQTSDPTSDHAGDPGRGGDPLIDGSVHDEHAEVTPDPAIQGGADRHRDDVAAVEAADGRASGETLGTTQADHHRTRRADDDPDPDV